MTELSLKAKGLWAYLMSLPDNWKINIIHLQKALGCGEKAICSALNELMKFGLVTRHQENNGKFGQIEYTIYEVPQDELKKCLPRRGFAGTEKSDPPKAGLTSTELLKEDRYKNQEQEQKKVSSYASALEEEEVFVSLLEIKEECSEKEATQAYWGAKVVEAQGKIKKDVFSWMIIAIRNRFQLPDASMLKHKFIGIMAAKIYKKCYISDDVLCFEEISNSLPFSRVSFIDDFKKIIHDNKIECLHEIL